MRLTFRLNCECNWYFGRRDFVLFQVPDAGPEATSHFVRCGFHS